MEAELSIVLIFHNSKSVAKIYEQRFMLRGDKPRKRGQ